MSEKKVRWIRWALLLVATLLQTTAWSSAALEIDGDEDAAKAHFRTGQNEYGQAHFEEALIAFGMAYRAWPHPAFLFNIGQCHRQLGDHAAAIFFFQAFLDGVPDAGNREAVDGLIGESLAALGEEGQAADYEVPPEFASLVRGSEKPSEEEGPAAAPPEALSPVGPDRKDDSSPYAKWWLWTAVAVVIAGTAVGIGVAGRDDPLPDRTMTPIDLR